MVANGGRFSASPLQPCPQPLQPLQPQPTAWQILHPRGCRGHGLTAGGILSRRTVQMRPDDRRAIATAEGDRSGWRHGAPPGTPSIDLSPSARLHHAKHGTPPLRLVHRGAGARDGHHRGLGPSQASHGLPRAGRSAISISNINRVTRQPTK
jgi:hypothetical protein